MSDELPPPADPFVEHRYVYSGMLDRARQLRLALCDAPDLAAVLAAVGALDDEECRLVVLELAMSEWREREKAREGERHSAG